MGVKCRVLVGKHEGKGTLGRRRRKWEDNIVTRMGGCRRGLDW
jgi:hypothetical protein